MNDNKHQRRDDQRPRHPLQWEDAPPAPIPTWRDRLGRPADFPLHNATDVERAMEAEIAELRALAQQDATSAIKLPPLDDELRAILGRPNFNCIQIAARMRELGHEIETRAEHEQAAAIHLLLDFYLKYGAVEWFTRATEYLLKPESDAGQQEDDQKGGAA